jgi:hypothetical protein
LSHISVPGYQAETPLRLSYKYNKAAIVGRGFGRHKAFDLPLVTKAANRKPA